LGRFARAQHDFCSAQREPVEAEAAKFASRRQRRSGKRGGFGATAGGFQSLRFSQWMGRLEANDESKRLFTGESRAWPAWRRADAVTARTNCGDRQRQGGSLENGGVGLEEHCRASIGSDEHELIERNGPLVTPSSEALLLLRYADEQPSEL
jgi:hypothetical protein